MTIAEQDNFLLAGTVYLMDREMKKLNANMQIVYFPGDYSTVHKPDYRQKGFKFLADRDRQWENRNKKGF